MHFKDYARLMWDLDPAERAHAVQLVNVPRIPLTYVELCSMLQVKRDRGERYALVDEFVDMVGQSDDPDNIVQQLPYFQVGSGDIGIAFVLPPPDLENK
jgi:hypothetical protein